MNIKRWMTLLLMVCIFTLTSQGTIEAAQIRTETRKATLVPAAPESAVFTASQAKNKTTTSISWVASKEADGYKIYKRVKFVNGKTGRWNLVAIMKDNQKRNLEYTWEELTHIAGSSTEYAVSAFSDAGESRKTRAHVFKQNRYNVKKVTLSSKREGHLIQRTLSWTKVRRASLYHIYYRTVTARGKCSEWKPIASVNAIGSNKTRYTWKEAIALTGIAKEYGVAAQVNGITGEITAME